MSNMGAKGKTGGLAISFVPKSRTARGFESRRVHCRLAVHKSADLGLRERSTESNRHG